MGFEPTRRENRLHAFQACAFDHSATSPFILTFSAYLNVGLFNMQSMKAPSTTRPPLYSFLSFRAYLNGIYCLYIMQLCVQLVFWLGLIIAQ